MSCTENAPDRRSPPRRRCGGPVPITVHRCRCRPNARRTQAVLSHGLPFALRSIARRRLASPRRQTTATNQVPCGVQSRPLRSESHRCRRTGRSAAARDSRSSALPWPRPTFPSAARECLPDDRPACASRARSCRSSMSLGCRAGPLRCDTGGRSRAVRSSHIRVADSRRSLSSPCAGRPVRSSVAI